MIGIMSKRFTKHVIITLIFCFIAGSVGAQTVQYGRVVEMNSHGKTLSGVSIMVPSVHDCQPASSDAHGEFRLCFSEHFVGDVVYGIRARKYGYEVVNLHFVKEGWTLTAKDSLRIVMAPTEKIAEARARYYDWLEQASVARFDTTMSYLNHQYALEQLSDKEFDYWKLMAENELQRSYERLDAQADRLARVCDEVPDDRLLSQRLKADDLEGAVALLEVEAPMTVLEACQHISAPLENEALPVALTEQAGDSITISEANLAELSLVEAYTDMFEQDFPTSGAKYAKACLFLGTRYQELGLGYKAKQYLRKALTVYQALQEMEGKDYGDVIKRIKALLLE